MISIMKSGEKLFQSISQFQSLAVVCCSQGHLLPKLNHRGQNHPCTCDSQISILLGLLHISWKYNLRCFFSFLFYKSTVNIFWQVVKFKDVTKHDINPWVDRILSHYFFVYPSNCPWRSDHPHWIMKCGWMDTFVRYNQFLK